MILQGIKREYMDLEVTKQEIFAGLKRELLGSNVDLNRLCIKDDTIVEVYHYHGSWEEDELVTNNPEKVEIFKLINELEDKMKDIK